MSAWARTYGCLARPGLDGRPIRNRLRHELAGPPARRRGPAPRGRPTRQHGAWSAACSVGLYSTCAKGGGHTATASLTSLSMMIRPQTSTNHSPSWLPIRNKKKKGTAKNAIHGFEQCMYSVVVVDSVCLLCSVPDPFMGVDGMAWRCAACASRGHVSCGSLTACRMHGSFVHPIGRL